MARRPKPYPQTTPAELEAIKTLEFLFSTKYIKSYINRNDKIPNHDGKLEVTDGDQHPIGEFSVQVKKLNPKNGLKYKFDAGFINFCSVSLLPVLAFIVDTQNRKAYWLHLDNDLINGINLDNKKTVTLNFEERKCISEDNEDYVLEWKTILESEIQSKIDRKTAQKEIQNLKEKIALVRELKDKSYQLSQEVFVILHKFLDHYNYLLDNTFAVVKRLIYPGVWKNGVAVESFTDRSVRFMIYPVPWNFNDTLIKWVDIDAQEDIMQNAKRFIGRYSENPFLARPQGYAFELVQDDVNRLIKERRFRHSHPSLLCEYLFDFIDQCHFALGLEPNQKSYLTKDIELGFFQYLPLLVDALYSNAQDGGYNFAVLEDLAWNIEPKFRKKLDKQIRQWIKEEKSTSQSFQLISRNVDLDQLTDSIDALRANEVQHIDTPYHSRRVFRPFTVGTKRPKSLKALKSDFEFLFQNLPDAYNAIVKEHFPVLYDELKFNRNGAHMAIVVGANLPKPFVRNGELELNIYQLASDEETDLLTPPVFFSDLGDEVPLDKDMGFKRNVAMLQGKSFRIHSYSASDTSLITEKMPLQEQVYKLLQSRFDEYFKRRIKEGGQ